MSALASSIASTFFWVGLLGLAAGLIAAYVRPMWMRAALLVLYAALMTTNVATAGAFFREAAFRLAVIVALWFGVTRLARFNVLGYFLVALIVALAPAASKLVRQPSPYLRANGYAVIVILLAIWAWPLIRWKRADPA